MYFSEINSSPSFVKNSFIIPLSQEDKIVKQVIMALIIMSLNDEIRTTTSDQSSPIFRKSGPLDTCRPIISEIAMKKNVDLIIKLIFSANISNMGRTTPINPTKQQNSFFTHKMGYNPRTAYRRESSPPSSGPSFDTRFTQRERKARAKNNYSYSESVSPEKVTPAVKCPHREALGVSSTASFDEIRKAYKKIALKYHPDKTENLKGEELDEANEKFRKAAEANEYFEANKPSS